MANLNQIQNKIKSTSSLRKITRALEVVSTIKLQKSKDKAESLKEYLVDLLLIMNSLWDKIDIFRERKWKRKEKPKLSIVITTDKWLCGSLNSKLLKKVSDKLVEKRDDIFVVWKKWLDFFSRAWYNVVWNLSLKDNFVDEDLLPLFAFVREALSNYKYSKVTIYFNYFKNSLIQIPTSVQIYPMQKETFQEFACDIDLVCSTEFGSTSSDIIIEPTVGEFIREMHRQIRNYIIESAIIQNKAWEHASRMIAMKNATDNSKSFIDTLTLSFNKARQASVTQEISEIVSAKIAME